MRRFITGVSEAALSRGGICPVLWDTTDQHYDRSTYQMTDSILGSQLLEIKDKYVAKDKAGDVNDDGDFTVADVVMLQQYLLGGSLAKRKNADLCEDGQIDVYDLCIMKKELIASGS